MPSVKTLSRFCLIALVLLAACRQELSGDADIPEVTSAFMTDTPTLTPSPTATPTRVFSPAEALAAGPINIVTIGDDLTRGDGDDMGRGYPGRLLELISQIRPGSAVVNFGQTGWTSDEVVYGNGEFSGQLERATQEVHSAAGQQRATVVLVWIGGNDLWELYTGDTVVVPEMEEQDVLRFSANLDAILLELRRAGAQIILAELDDQSERPARTRNEVYPAITGDELRRMSAQTQRYNEAISQKAEQYGALTVSFHGSPIFTDSETLAPDGYHPNPAGYELIAQAWYKALIPILP